MSARRAMRAIAAVALLAAPACAAAQGGSGVYFYISGSGPPVAQVSMPVRISGQVTVAFHGDAATGCSARGTCGVSGTLYWQPSPTGTLQIAEFRRNHKTEWIASLGLASDSIAGNGAVTTARVRLSPADPPSNCNDVQQSPFLIFPVRRGQIVFSFPAAAPGGLETRCAGPLASDLGSAWPAPSLHGADALRGRTAMDMSGTRGFAANGFAGTVDSTLRVQLGRPSTVPNQSGNSTPSGASRLRMLEVTYTAAIRGSVLVKVSGERNPAFCTPLGDCGSTGSISVRPVARHVVARVDAFARASRPGRDLLAAFGLSRKGRAAGVLTIGNATWDGGGSVAESIGQTAGGCRDTVGDSGGDISLTTGAGMLRAEFSTTSAGSFGLRTRCPGPFGSAGLGTGRIPLSALAKRTVTIPISSGESFSEDGYTGRTVPRLTLTLRRVSVHSSVHTVPGG